MDGGENRFPGIGFAKKYKVRPGATVATALRGRPLEPGPPLQLRP